MKKITRMLLPAAIATMTAVAGWAGTASAHDAPPRNRDHAVFIETDNANANEVIAYHRNSDGTLGAARRYATRGRGTTIQGAVVDPLASQGAVTYDALHRLLYAVNGGSNSLSVFAVNGDRLTLRQVIGSGGATPVSVAAHGNLVYVLNAGNGGSVDGYAVFDGSLRFLPYSHRALGLGSAPSPDMNFLYSPGQVGFSPTGRQVLVATKANGSTIDVFAVQHDGRLSAKPVVTPSATPVPFGFVFDARGHLVSAEAGASTLSTYALHTNGTLSLLGSLPDNQKALCWIAEAGRFFYVANAGSGTVSGYTVDAAGRPAFIGDSHTATPGVLATTSGGTIDLAATPDGHFLYVQSGKIGALDAYRIGFDGTLRHVASISGFGAGGLEGIATN